MRYTIDLNVLADNQGEAEKIAIERAATWFDVPRACVSATVTGARTSPIPGKMYAAVTVEEVHRYEQPTYGFPTCKGCGRRRV